MPCPRDEGTLQLGCVEHGAVDAQADVAAPGGDDTTEAGTEAAAVTSIGMMRASFMPKKTFRMIVDRPFFCAIRDTQTGATEFRTDFYAAAPGSDLVGELDAVDLDADAFFGVPPGPSVDTSGFACDTTPDVVLTLDFTNPIHQL